MNRRYLFLGTSLLLLAGCTVDVQTERDDRQVPVRLSVSQEAAVTRASDGLYTASTGFDGTENVEVYVNNISTHATFSVGTPDATTKKSDLTGTLYYPTSGTINLFAVYPSTSTASHTVKYNQTSAANYKASDLMYAKTTVAQADKENTQNLAFEHQLVKLKVVIVKAADVSQVTQVVMNNVKRKATVSLSASALTLTGLTTATGDDATGGDNILVSSGEESSINEETYTYAVVFPVQPWDGDEFITVTADEKSETCYLTKNDFVAGNEYTLTLNVNAASLDNTVTIDNWTGTTGSCSVEPVGYLSIEDIPSEFYTGSAIEPTLSVKFKDTPLTLNTDYTVEYKNNTEAGEAVAVVTGINSYAGATAAKSFSIRGVKMLPLWYVAQYNVMSIGENPTMADNGDACIYINWQTALNVFGAQNTTYSDYKTAGVSIDGVNWHLPTRPEWWSISPLGEGIGNESYNFDDIDFTSLKTGTVAFGYNKDTKNGIRDVSYWKKISDTEFHAIRFLGTDYCSAWKYEELGGFTAENHGYVKVSAQLIDIVDENFANAKAWYDDYWSSVSFDNIFSEIRTFYALGQHSYSTLAASQPTSTSNNEGWYTGTYMTTYGYNNEDGTMHYFTVGNPSSGIVKFHFGTGGGYKRHGRIVRLFRDN